MRWRQLLFAMIMSTTVAFGSGSTADERSPFDPLFERLSLCEIYHLTPGGYLLLAPSIFLFDVWPLQAVDILARDARRRPPFKIDLRSTVHLQLASASSYQAAAAFRALATFMRETGYDAVSRISLAQAAQTAYRARLASEGYEDCFIIKWGNRYPDVFAQPLRKTTWRAIAALFETDAARRFALTEHERRFVDSGYLTEDEIVELRGIRIAAYIFENEFDTLKRDRGGFDGNMDHQPLVCTDEATTMWFLIRRLEKLGHLRFFSTQHGRFVHRTPNLVLPTDHFGVLLLNRRNGAYLVVDSWVEDGGLPPHISRIEDWFDRGERRSVVSIGDPALDKALLEGKISHDDGNGFLTRLETHLAPFSPPNQNPRPDGRPPTCEFHWCEREPSDALREVW